MIIDNAFNIGVFDIAIRLETRINIEGDIKFEGSFNLKERQPPGFIPVQSLYYLTAILRTPLY